MNNPKDITFAAGYMLTICFLLKFIKDLPNPSWKTTLLVIAGIGIGLGSRAPGIILIAYVPFFVGFEILFRKGLYNEISKDKTAFKAIVLKMLSMTLGGYLLGIIFWPFALTNPFKNVLVAVDTLTNFPTIIKTIFGGTKIASTMLPWYYVPKLIGISTPLFFLLGLCIFVAVFPFIKTQFQKRYLLLLLFVAIFPLYYAVHKHSAFYNGWRHTTFIYPPLVVLSALSFEFLLQKLNGLGQKVTIGILAVLCALPLWFMIKNHPYQGIYYNELQNGVKGAYGKYEIDYAGVSVHPIANWMKENLDMKSKPLEIATDYPNNLIPEFSQYPNVKIRYVRYFERERTNWDYAVFLTTHLDPTYINNPISFPPKGTLFKTSANDKALGVLMKRLTLDDMKGYTLFAQNKIAESIPYFENAAKIDPNNETTHYYLSRAYNNSNQVDKALREVQTALDIFPNYSSASIALAVIYINTNKLDDAIYILNKVLVEYPENTNQILQYLAIAYEKKGDMRGANHYRALIH